MKIATFLTRKGWKAKCSRGETEAKEEKANVAKTKTAGMGHFILHGIVFIADSFFASVETLFIFLTDVRKGLRVY